MHDMSELEKAGLPCCALVSSAFLPQARWQANQLGLNGVEHLLVGVQHPFSDQNLEQIRGKADAVYEATVNALVKKIDPYAVAAVAVKPEKPEEEEGECKT
jgi:hypothetical protein